METRFQNLLSLRKALEILNINYREEEKNSTNSELSDVNLVIPQSNGYDLEFAWNVQEQEYELVVDISFWEQPYPIESFIDKIAQQYAGELIIAETKKIGFQVIKYEPDSNGSNLLILERWNKTTNNTLY